MSTLENVHLFLINTVVVNGFGARSLIDLKLCFLTECRVDTASGDYVYNFIYPRLQSSDVFRLDFSVKGSKDAILSLSEFTDETLYYDVGKMNSNNQ